MEPTVTNYAEERPLEGDEAPPIGHITQTTASAVRIRILPDPRGYAPSAAKVSTYVAIPLESCILLGQITELNAEYGTANAGIVGNVDILASLSHDGATVAAGALDVPPIGAQVYFAPARFVRTIAEQKRRTGTGEGSGQDVVLHLANLTTDETQPILLTPEMLFSRHCAIVGATGSGKSWTVARAVEELARYRSKVILFDASGEFESLSKGVLHVYFGRPERPLPNSYEVVLPYSQLTERDLFAIFKPAGQGQAPKLRAAIQSLKLIRYSPSLGVDGTIIKANRAKQHYETEYAKHISLIENPKADFDISCLPRQISHECVHPNRSALETQYWGELNGAELSMCVPLINRISDIIQSPSLGPLFQPAGKTSVLEVIDAFLKDRKYKVLCISMEHLSFLHGAREIIANAIGRFLLEQARLFRFVKNPVVTIVDEAHQFLNERLDVGDNSYPLDAFGLIAKEGRKYALTVCLATQRPRDIPPDVLSQMGTFMVHRLVNDNDRHTIERACGEMSRSILASIPTLPPGQAVIIGVELNTPLRVNMVKPSAPPRSHSPNYQVAWRNTD